MFDYISNALSRYPEALWFLMVELAPWLFLGLILAGIIEIVFPESRVQKWLGDGSRFAVWRAALIGVPLPLCSCGVVPVALSLRRRGASRGATVSFLVTTPQSGLDSIAATWGLMGAPFAIFRTVLTFVTGLFAGHLVQWTDQQDRQKSLVGEFKNETDHPSLWIRLIESPWIILKSIGKWLVIGILLAALIEVMIPSGYVTGSFLEGFWGMVLLASFALPLYVCATASIPLAMEFVAKGFSPGAAFVFLLVGPATNFATALIIKKEIGARAMFVYLFSILFFGLGSGWLIDQYIIELPIKELHSHQHDNGFLKMLAVLLSILLSYIMISPLFKKSRGEKAVSQNQIQVNGMTCDHCRKSVENAVGSVAGVSNVSVDLQEGKVFFEDGDSNKIKEAIVKAGYETA